MEVSGVITMLLLLTISDVSIIFSVLINYLTESIVEMPRVELGSEKKTIKTSTYIVCTLIFTTLRQTDKPK